MRRILFLFALAAFIPAPAIGAVADSTRTNLSITAHGRSDEEVERLTRIRISTE